jgi:3',5'-cyclic AMP phosphodiesterase CpdA
LFFAQTHMNCITVFSWPEGDILVHAGDFTMIGTPEKIEEFGMWLRDSPFSAIVIIAGNHAILFQKKPE